MLNFCKSHDTRLGESFKLHCMANSFCSNIEKLPIMHSYTYSYNLNTHTHTQHMQYTHMHTYTHDIHTHAHTHMYTHAQIHVRTTQTLYSARADGHSGSYLVATVARYYQ